MSMITQDSAVTLHFTIKMKDGSVADSTQNMGKPAKCIIGDGSLSENFEKCLLGLEQGDKKSIELKADDAFGQPNPDHIHHMDRAKFVGDAEVEVGTIMAFSGLKGLKFQVLLLRLPATP
ncbi:FKBP-type peptidyl-prolyl cis-trans isomerase SlpA [Vibrio astriarenae]|nr:FKBP-type peptidyl-prolyl cis-trans isomerase SlpA [Vibrio sp. C7]